MGAVVSLTRSLISWCLSQATERLGVRFLTETVLSRENMSHGGIAVNPISLTVDELGHLETELLSSWATLPVPPADMKRYEVALHLLGSPGYQASPGTLDWPQSNHVSYQTLWGICQKISRRGPLEATMRRLLVGRSREGYLAYHKAGLVRDDDNLPRLTSDPDISEYMARMTSGAGIQETTSGECESSIDAETRPSGYMFVSMEQMTMRSCSESLLIQLD